MCRMRAAIRPTLPIELGPGQQAAHRVEATAATYADALAAIGSQLPERWRLIALVPDDDRVLAHLHRRPHPATEGS